MGSRFRVGVVAVVVAVAVAGCGGRAGTTVPGVPHAAGGNTGAGYSGALAVATLRLTIPAAAGTTAASRRPAYVSSATASVVITLNSASALTTAQLSAFQSSSGTGTFNVGTLPSATCPSNGSGYTCSFTLKLPPGTDTLTLTTYSGTNASGSVLSQQNQSFTVSAGSGNVLSMTLDANANAMAVTASTNYCSTGMVGSSVSSVGTSPAAFTVAYTDPAGKTITSPGMPKLAVTVTNPSGGTIATNVNQSAETFTLTPSNSSASGTITVTATPANTTGSSDGLSFSQSKSFTFATGPAPPSHGFLAVIDPNGSGGGAIDLFTLAVGSGSGSPDSLSAYSPSTLASTASSNEGGVNDIDSPQDIAFDAQGDILVANSGTLSGNDTGNFACIPAGSIATGNDTSVTTETDVAGPEEIALGTDGSVALANRQNTLSGSGAQSTYIMPEYVLQSGSGYVATSTLTGAYSNRDVTTSSEGSNYHAYSSVSLTAIPATGSLLAGTFAVGLYDNTNLNSTSYSEVAIVNPTSPSASITRITYPSANAVQPNGLGWDPVDNQLIVATWDNDGSGVGSLYTYNAGSTSPSYSTTLAPADVATTGDEYVAEAVPIAVSSTGELAVDTASGCTTDDRILLYSSGYGTRTLVGQIPFDVQTSGGTNLYSGVAPGGSVAVAVHKMLWLSSTKLLVQLAIVGATSPSAEGLYVFDTSSDTKSEGYDECNPGIAEPAGPAQTMFHEMDSALPKGFAYKP